MADLPETDTDSSSTVLFAPYFIESFTFILKHVTSDATFSNLFNESDRKHFAAFNELNEDSKIIYLTLFRRSRILFRRSTLRLSMNTSDLDTIFEKLVAQDFLTIDVAAFSDTDLLHLLERKEINELAAHFKIPIKGTKKDMIGSLLKAAREPTIVSFFTSNSNKGSPLRQLALRSLGSCCALNTNLVKLFSRCILLFSLAADKGGPITSSISFTAHLSNEMYALLQVRRGEAVYPRFIVSRKSAVFRNREELICYTELYSLKHQLECLTFTSQYQQAFELFNQHENQLMNILKGSKYLRSDLPKFLHHFTIPYLSCRLIRIGVGICERLRLYSKSVTLILAILTPALPSLKRKRPRKGGSSPPSSSVNPYLSLIGSKAACGLFMRYMIDEGTHQRKIESCLSTLAQIMGTKNSNTEGEIGGAPFLRAGHRLEVQRQIRRLLEKKQAKIKKMKIDGIEEDIMGKKIRSLIDDLLPPLISAPVVKLFAPINGSSTDLGNSRPLYIWTAYTMKESVGEGGSGDGIIESSSTLLTVEDWALRHYMQNEGFEKGLHSESSIYVFLFLLLFYDLLFPQEEIREDVFFSLRQTAPLDLFSGDFYENKRSAIEARLDLIANARQLTPAEILVHPVADAHVTDDLQLIVTDPVSQIVNTVWTEHKDERCVGACWDLFSNSQEVVNLFWCLGPRLVSAFCRLLAQDWRNWHSGLPDLCVWGPSKAKLIEVKGPGDTLSCQQMMWIDKLLSFGANVELCSVVAVSRNSLM